MVDLFLVLLRILFPLNPVRRLWEVTRDYLSELMDRLEDPDGFADLVHDPHACADLEAHIAVAEQGIHLLIHERARQILGLPFEYTPRSPVYPRHRAKPLRQVIARFSRAAALFQDIERLAQRRAARMRHEMEQNPLPLDASHHFSSATRLNAFTIQISSLSARHWRGQRATLTIGASSRRDGRGARAPPPKRLFANNLPSDSELNF